MAAAQISLFHLRKEKRNFGGSLLKNSHAKEKRPVTIRAPMHMVLRSEIARGPLSLLRNERRIQKIVYAQGRKFGVKIYRLANAGNHIHLILLPRSRNAFNGFTRALSGLIARAVMRAERGRAKGQRFWDQRPFTRILAWGKDYKIVCDYLLQNTLEALGFLPYRPRKVPRVMTG